MPYVTVASERLFYTPVEGDPSRQHNLVLVHGAGGNHTQWPAELRRMAGVNVYALDLPGHGRSGGHGRTSVEDYADSVYLFVQAVGLERAVLAGHSMGGAIAQTLALRQPPWLKGIALIATGARLQVNPQIMDGLRPKEKFEEAIDLICQWSYGPTTSDQMLRKGRQQLLNTDPLIMRGDYLACDQFDVMDRVSAISLPALIICGSADQMTPPKYSQYLRDQIRSAQLVEIRDAGHMLALEKPAEIAPMVERFVRELR